MCADGQDRVGDQTPLARQRDDDARQPAGFVRMERGVELLLLDGVLDDSMDAACCVLIAAVCSSRKRLIAHARMPRRSENLRPLRRDATSRC